MQAELFLRLAECCAFGCLAGIHAPAGKCVLPGVAVQMLWSAREQNGCLGGILARCHDDGDCGVPKCGIVDRVALEARHACGHSIPQRGCEDIRHGCRFSCHVKPRLCP